MAARRPAPSRIVCNTPASRSVRRIRSAVSRGMSAPSTKCVVENTGRVNYSHAVRTEQAGLTGPVTLDGLPLNDWRMYRLPMDDLSKLRFSTKPCVGPCFYEAEMTVNAPADTYLDTRGLHKGQLWLGEHNLGRFWSIGPVHTLYAPAPWMQRGANRIRFFDLTGDASDRLTTVAAPTWAESQGSNAARASSRVSSSFCV